MSQKHKRRAPTDATLRNTKASLKRDQALTTRIEGLEAWIALQMKVLANRVDAIERWKEAWSRQEVPVERDNVEGGQQP